MAEFIKYTLCPTLPLFLGGPAPVDCPVKLIHLNTAQLGAVRCCLLAPASPESQICPAEQMFLRVIIAGVHVAGTGDCLYSI